MTLIDPPSHRQWTERLRWFDDRLRRAGGGGPLQVDAQTEAILTELRRVFAAGAWVTAVILAQTAIDSDVADQVGHDDWEMEEADVAVGMSAGGRAGGGGGLHLNTVRFGRDYVWLRDKRNGYVHNDDRLPAITARELALEAARLEQEARKAVELMADALAGAA
ncbi:MULTISPECIES: hypothetical protein [Thalassobaculum]|uniref:Uncharacterized protein n=1 Tax=Thalassobaculum litoreum DSM 18839 TaxID=1123362 RepID=A0A8G2F5E7_9PROT|nr:MULTISPECIES: hypothetical protein [Thalassobaculum]SDG47097.1 hypothetical protein SAMN05660686_04528 [Thalassobaculum litoreum DSM 18839]